MPLPYVNSYWPSNYEGCTVQGTFVGMDGAPVSGTIDFAATPVALLDYAALKTIIPRGFTVTLDATGSFSIVLPATDDPDISPINWTYTVTQNFLGGRSFSIAAPKGTTVDLTNVAPMPSSDGTPIVRGPAGPAGSVASVGGIGPLPSGDVDLNGYALLTAANLADVANPATARANIGAIGAADTATLTNKTLTNPAINGGTITGAVFVSGEEDGDATHPAVIGKATAPGGKTLSLRNSISAEVASADDAGNATFTGTVTANLLTAPGLTASGDGKVSGVIVPKQYSSASVATAAFGGSPPIGALVYLSAPLNAPGGLYQWTPAGVWAPVSTDTGWEAFTNITAGWSAVDNLDARFRNGVVWLRGGLSNASFASSTLTTVAVLPSGIPAPAVAESFPMAQGSNSAVRYARIDTAGNIQVASPNAVASAAYFELSGISYLVD